MNGLTGGRKSLEKNVTKVSYSIRFEPETLEDLLGTEEYRKLIEETSGDEPLEDHRPCRRIMVVVDGYHVRHALQLRDGRNEPELVADWIDRLGSWLADRFMTDDHGLEVYVRAWDAHLPDEEEGQRVFKELPQNQRVHFANGRGHRYVGQHTTWLSADWHFTDLRSRGRTDVQSGVDARIAADIIGMALERPDVLIVVTGDQDFEMALKVVEKLEHKPPVELLTMQPKESRARLLADVTIRRWSAYPKYVGPDFALAI